MPPDPTREGYSLLRRCCSPLPRPTQLTRRQRRRRSPNGSNLRSMLCRSISMHAARRSRTRSRPRWQRHNADSVSLGPGADGITSITATSRERGPIPNDNRSPKPYVTTDAFLTLARVRKALVTTVKRRTKRATSRAPLPGSTNKQWMLSCTPSPSPGSTPVRQAARSTERST